MFNTEWDFDNHHPACPGGCGQLADECACRRPRLERTLAVTPPWDPALDDDRAAPCRWRGCRAEAESRGYCDVHLGTL